MAEPQNCDRCHRVMSGSYAPESGSLCQPCIDEDTGVSPMLPFPGTDAEMFIQWKGTEICLDFHCPCDSEKGFGHLDATGANVVRCPNCKNVYELGTQVRARKLTEAEAMKHPYVLDIVVDE